GLHIRVILALDRAEAADAGATDGTTARRIRFREVQARILDGLDARGDSVVHELVHAPQFLGVEIATRVEVLHLPAEAHREVRDVEPSDRSNAALAGENGLPRGLHRAAHGRDQSQARHDHTTLAHTLPVILRCFWNSCGAAARPIAGLAPQEPPGARARRVANRSERSARANATTRLCCGAR